MDFFIDYNLIVFKSVSKLQCLFKLTRHWNKDTNIFTEVIETWIMSSHDSTSNSEAELSIIDEKNKAKGELCSQGPTNEPRRRYKHWHVFDWCILFFIDEFVWFLRLHNMYFCVFICFTIEISQQSESHAFGLQPSFHSDLSLHL